MKMFAKTLLLSLTLCAACGQGPSSTNDIGAAAAPAASGAALSSAPADFSKFTVGAKGRSLEVREFVSRVASPAEVEAHRADIAASRIAARAQTSEERH
jgi:hypothetical protein